MIGRVLALLLVLAPAGCGAVGSCFALFAAECRVETGIGTTVKPAIGSTIDYSKLYPAKPVVPPDP